jgi:hypothetical protein
MHSLIPAFSHRRRRIVRHLTENRATEFSGRSSEGRETDYDCPLSLEERVRVRVSVNTIHCSTLYFGQR